MNPRINSAGIIPVFKQGQEWNYLILRCFKYWDFPKGEVDGDEGMLETAIRELAEETSLVNPTILTSEFIETEPYAKNKVARYYIAEVKSTIVELLPNPEDGLIEHHEYRWLSFNEARSFLNPRLQAVIDWAKVQLDKQ
jgi:bis(5'-nucleosidyl)-tetraphosphatase